MHTFGKIGCLASAGGITTQLVSVSLLYEYTAKYDLHEDDRDSLTHQSTVPILQLIAIAYVVLVVYLGTAWICVADEYWKIIWRSQFLGVMFGLGVSINIYCIDQYVSLGWYICVMSFFHFSEFVMVSVIRPQNLSTESFLLNHSKAYFLAALMSWFEYIIELLLLPDLKNIKFLSFIGLVLCLGGEALRKVAMLTAFNNFDHLIRTRREEKHELVTSGIYRLCRHPSYVGWFYWSIGTQVMLCNPLCTVAYTLVSWRFFNERIFEEELTLLHFFGDEYADYQKKVPTGLPFIQGYLC
nr:EOG090X0CFU [Ilyocryptus agilis]